MPTLKQLTSPTQTPLLAIADDIAVQLYPFNDSPRTHKDECKFNSTTENQCEKGDKSGKQNWKNFQDLNILQRVK